MQTSSLEDLLCSHAPLSSEDEASPGCTTSSQVTFKAFIGAPELHARGPDRKLSPLLSPLQDPLVDKTLLEPREMVRPKKVCFSESSLPTGDRTRRSYYLNGEARAGGPGDNPLTASPATQSRRVAGRAREQGCLPTCQES
ncbi:Hypothetical predicted protein [Marmota monax]|uniref:Speriolin N-terminal domain-containing protein n=1 Tax=Marmota monax TaxID=9995 RepID=A0A5E4BKF6_MARMO|nr:hypothetical protein GHT09_014546 [Marmota monax]VTJ69481.1 Hypothetical predicted protein [Marmota monax]